MQVQIHREKKPPLAGPDIAALVLWLVTR
jgi:hypothetical protein